MPNKYVARLPALAVACPLDLLEMARPRGCSPRPEGGEPWCGNVTKTEAFAPGFAMLSVSGLGQRHDRCRNVASDDRSSRQCGSQSQQQQAIRHSTRPSQFRRSSYAQPQARNRSTRRSSTWSRRRTPVVATREPRLGGSRSETPQTGSPGRGTLTGIRGFFVVQVFNSASQHRSFPARRSVVPSN